MVPWSNQKKSTVAFTLILLLGSTGPVEKTQAKIELLRDIPSVGMYLKYLMFTSINSVPFPPAKLYITHDSFEDPSNETIRTTLSVSFHLGWIAGTENGTIVENSTSRLLTKVEVPADGLLEILYGIYFDQTLPNFTPWWIFPENVTLGSPIRAFNVTLCVVNEESMVSSQIGVIDIWRAEASRINSSIVYEVTLLYEKISGILVAGNLWIFWERHNRSYNETFHLEETNAFMSGKEDEKIKEAMDLSWIGIILIALLPFALIILRLFRLRKLEGGLD